MLWPVVTLLSLAGLISLHFWWRARFRTLQETTARELAEAARLRAQAAAQAHSQEETLLNSLVDGLLLLDASGRIQLANPTCVRLFGLSTDVRGKTIIEALRLHELAALAESLTPQGPLLGHQLRLSHPQDRWLEVNGAIIVGPDGQRHGAVMAFHDLTRIKKLERTREEFVANVSHELRTPLSLIKGYAETLLDGAKDNPEVSTRFLRTIDRNAERLKLLIEDLLVISELESGRVKLNLQVVSLRGVVGKVLADFKAPAEAKDIQLADTAPEMSLRADPDRLEQVLFNLVDNAIKYGRSGGKVTVGARIADQQFAEVFVQDDGPGLPPEALDRVFERFYRVDKARSRDQGGTGLGLSIVKHIVQNHGGKVRVVSQLGHGATFSFSLPLDSGERQQPPP